MRQTVQQIPAADTTVSVRKPSALSAKKKSVTKLLRLTPLRCRSLRLVLCCGEIAGRSVLLAIACASRGLANGLTSAQQPIMPETTRIIMMVQAIANLHGCPRAHRSTDSNSWLVSAERSAGEVRGSAMARAGGVAQWSCWGTAPLPSRK